MLVLLVEAHHFGSSHDCGLVERGEGDVVGRAGLVGEGAFDSVKVVGADGDEGTLPRQVLVQLVLQRDEAVVALRGEGDPTQHGGAEVRPHARRVRVHDGRHHRLGRREGIGGHGLAAEEDAQVHRDALEAQHVVAVGRYFDLELRRLFDAIYNRPLALRCVLVQLNTVVEAQRVKFIPAVLPAQCSVELGLVDSDGRHAGQTPFHERGCVCPSGYIFPAASVQLCASSG